MPRHPAHATADPPDHTTASLPPPREWLDADALVAAGVAPSRYAVYRATRAGDLPEPAVVGGRHLWNRAVLERFLLDRAAARASARAATRAALQRNVG
ncbi:hypothetical protein [Roseomonas rosulenta]|uniref:hypothetical protein n=1 Tax=Roseomonas rosulenta TaxID=2748667 RepID=UPI0018DF767C|nr:hypothetical protein [Roseomonas rosulenta]